MVAISTYKSLWEYIASVVSGIDKVLLVHEEYQIADLIRDVEAGCVFLLFILPSADADAPSADDYEEKELCYLFIVKKSNPGDITHDEWLLEMEQTQLIMGQVKDKMIELATNFEHGIEPGSFAHLMHRLVLNGMHTDPEYNLLGCNGYGLTFSLKTKGTQNQ